MMRLLEQLEGFASHKISTLKLIFKLFKMEAKLASLSIFPLVANIGMLFIVLISLWTSIMLLIGYGAFIYWDNFIGAVAAVALINLVFLLGLLKYLTFNLESMSFKKTRAYFSSQESNKDDRLTKKIDDANFHVGKATKSTRKKTC